MTDAQRYLSKVRQADLKINSRMEEMARLKELATKVTSTMSDNPTFGGGNQDKLGDVVAKIVDLQSEINQDVDRYVDLKKQANGILNRIENTDHYQVLHKRYIMYKSFAEIACEMHYSLRWVTKLHGRALQTFDKLMPNGEKTNV